MTPRERLSTSIQAVRDSRFKWAGLLLPLALMAGRGADNRYAKEQALRDSLANVRQRFVLDSLHHYYETREIMGVILRVDSGVKEIKARRR